MSKHGYLVVEGPHNLPRAKAVQTFLAELLEIP